MCPLTFSKLEFLEIQQLKYVLTNISIKLFYLAQTIVHLQNFADSLSEKLQDFLPKYDCLKNAILELDQDKLYYTDNIAKLGFECLQDIDIIGDFTDKNIEKYYEHLNNKFNNLIDIFL